MSQDKRLGEEDVVAELDDGMTIGIGGWGSRRQPMSIVRASLRSGLSDLTANATGQVEQEYPTEIAGVRLDNYIDWMKSCYWITVTSHPAISVPAGFTPDGLPVGLQIVGRYRDDFGVLQLAHAYEQETKYWKRRPAAAE